MKRLVPFLVTLILLSPCSAQEVQPSAKKAASGPAASPPPIPPQERFAGAMSPPTFVAPPLPGQVRSDSPMPAVQPVPALSPNIGRTPEMKDTRPVAVPSYAPANTKVTSSTSSSGQFIVYGDDLQARSNLSGRCDEISQELSRILRDKQPWVLPIVVRLVVGDAAREPGPVVKTSISWIPTGGFHIQVNVKVRPELRPKEFRDELIRALLAERILRGVKEFDSKRTLLPEWVYTGILEAIDFRQRARPSAFFAAIFKSGKIYGIEEIIEASPTQMDSLSKTIYQTSCCALVLALLDQPEGGMRFGKFLGAFASDKRPERELLNQWFPGFASSSTSLNKWWSLQLAALAAPTLTEPMSTAETVTQLNEALMFRFQAKASAAPKPRHVEMAVARPDSPPPPRKVNLQPTESAPVRVASKPQHTRSSHSVKTASIAAQNKPEAPTPEANESQPSVAEAPAPTTRSTPKPLLERFFESSTEAKPADESASVPSEEPKAFSLGGITSLLGFGKKDAPAEEEKPQEVKTESPVAMEKPAEPKPKAQTPKAQTPKPKPAIEEAPSEPAPEANPEEKKANSLNPLNWFRGGKKETKETAPAEPSAEIKTSMMPSVDAILWAWSPLMADLYSATGMEIPSAPQSQQVESILDRLKFGKKKEGVEEPSTETPEPKPAKEEKPVSAEKKKTPPSPAPIKEEKPIREEPKDTPFSSQDSLSRLRSLFSGGKKEEESVKITPPPAPPALEKPAPVLPPTSAPASAPVAVPTPPAPTPQPVVAVEPAPRPKPKPKPKPAPIVQKKEKPIPAPAQLPTPAPIPMQAVIPSSAPAPVPVPIPVNDTMVSVALPIEDFAEVMKRPDREEILRRNIASLNALQERSAVLFRPIITEYAAALIEMGKGKTKDLDARLSALRKRTILAAAQSKAVRDFVDVYEANESVSYSGKFDDYLNLPATIAKELPKRTDPISEYLDALDKEFSKE